ncbi:uncharacterized protein [Panulirus ornatus]
MQTDGVPNKDAGILRLADQDVSRDTENSGVPEGWSGWEGVAYTYSFTLCLWTLTTYFRPKPSAVSYAISSEYVNELYADISPKQVGFAFYSSFFSAHVKVQQEEWIHMCLWYDHSRSVRRLFVRGESLVEEHFTAPRPLFLNGTMVIGQEQDDIPGGGFDWYQSFGGKVTLVQLWKKPLSNTDIQKLASCNLDTEGDVLDWESAPWELEGSAKWEELPISDLCRPLSLPTLIFPEVRTIPVTIELCRIVGGSIPVPQNALQNEMLLAILGEFASNCGSRVGLWLGATDEDEEGIWRNIATNSILTYKPFSTRQPDGEVNENCLLLDYTRNGWSDWSCSVANQFCASCTFKAVQVYILRGLCEPNPDDTVFSLRGYKGGRPYWRGLYKYQVEYRGSYWILLDLWSNTTLATLEALSKTKYPDGINQWTVVVEKKICSAREGELRSLSLTRCLDGKFTCSDGSCVNESQRCDLRNHCSDGSDEDGCHNVITPPGYRSNLPPAPVVQSHTTTPISLVVQIERFSKIDTLNMEVSLDYTVQLSWLDPRLTFSNLKPPPKVNIVLVEDEKKVWVPEVNYPTGNGAMRLRQQTFTVRRLGDPQPDDVSQSIQDKVFHGTNASLVLTWKIHMPFTCNMQLLYYPFDVQVCVIPVVMASASVEYLVFEKPVAEYLGEKALTEVEVGEISVIVKNTTGDSMSSAVVSVKLRRRYAFFMTSTYFPTMLLLLVGYGTLYISLAMLQVRSIMSLTTLLVLTSLYTQTAASLPKTSYLKAIDIWLLYCIIVLVIIIVSHIFTDFVTNLNKPMKVLPAKTAVSKSSKFESFKTTPKNLGPALIRLMRILIPISFFIFNGFYWMFVCAVI